MEFTLSSIHKKRVLLAALDWGMGHTTRCVVLIRKLHEQQNEIIFAGTKTQCAFLEWEFPQVKFVYLDGYNITLSASKSTYWQLWWQYSKIYKAMENEHRQAKEWVNEFTPDVIISDNRYGFFHASCKNILLTHQLTLQLPRMKNLVNKQLKKWIEKFDAVWVPDQPDQKLTGELSKVSLKIPVIFIGYLARFQKREAPLKYDYLGIVSGPEPERSRFAIVLKDFLEKQNKRTALVGFKIPNSSIDCYADPSTGQLEMLIAESETVVSRAGYTTIMEMTELEKNAILIPTPGQYEQEYLAKNVQVKNIRFVTQEEFSPLKVKIFGH